MFIQVPATFKSFVTSRAVELFTAYVGFFTYNFCLYVQLLDCGSTCITLGLNVSYIINNPGILVRYSNLFSLSFANPDSNKDMKTIILI